jgi:gluconate 2-dehydrogenase gamma chain
MSDEKNSNEQNTLSRRRALKILGVGAGAAGAMSIYENPTFAQHHHAAQSAKTHAKAQAAKPRFFTPAEMATITAMSALIIPTDEQSPGAKEAGVPAFIDLMVSTSPEDVRKMWREGLASVDKFSQGKNQKNFVDASAQDQVKILEEISKNEFDPKTPEQQFFRAIKSLTIDGYYTSEIGIHQDLKYQGNAFLKEFPGCTHPEHKA